MGTNYYVRLPACLHACEHCAQASLLHLGKSSIGHRFLHRSYPVVGDDPWVVFDRDSWLWLLDLGSIVDEYGDLHTKEALLRLIENKQQSFPPPSRLRDGDFLHDGYHFCDLEFS